MAKVETIKFNKGLEVLKKNVIVKNPTMGVKPLTGKALENFKAKVNVHRPYCSSDFKKQYFIPDLSNI